MAALRFGIILGTMGEGSNDKSDRRRHTRASVAHPATARFFDLAEPPNVQAEHQAQLVDASFRGCQVATPPLHADVIDRLLRGEWVVELTAQGEGQALKISGKVKWHRETSAGVQLGLEYLVAVPDQVKLVEALLIERKPEKRGSPMAAVGALALVLSLAIFGAMWLGRPAPAPEPVLPSAARPSQAAKSYRNMHSAEFAAATPGASGAAPTPPPTPIDKSKDPAWEPTFLTELPRMTIAEPQYKDGVVTTVVRLDEFLPASPWLRFVVTDAEGTHADGCGLVMQVPKDKSDLTVTCRPLGRYVLPFKIEAKLN